MVSDNNTILIIIVENNCWIYLEMKQNVEKK